MKPNPKQTVCTKCGLEKSIDDFYKFIARKKGIRSECKACSKIYRDLHKKERRFYSKTHHQNNKEKRNANTKLNYQKHKEERKAKGKIYYEKNKERYKISNRNYRRARLKTDHRFRLNSNISTRIWLSLKNGKGGKSWTELLDYTIDELKKHLEKQFTKGMSWDNYGKDGWEVDHKIPVAVFNYTKPEHRDFKRCWALKNLQPMWLKENQKKHTKITKHFQPSLLL